MSLRTSITTALTVGFANALDDTAFEREHSELVDTMENVVTLTRKLPADAGVAAVEIDMSGITEGRLLYIESDVEIHVAPDNVLNTRLELARLVQPTSTQAPNLCCYLLATMRFTKLFLWNPSSTTVATVKICIVGDLVTNTCPV